MINTNKLKSAWTALGYSRKTAADAIGMKYSTFCRRLSDGCFNNYEIQAMIEAFNITEIRETFFERR